jgi:hypothetical protein
VGRSAGNKKAATGETFDHCLNPESKQQTLDMRRDRKSMCFSRLKGKKDPYLRRPNLIF